MSTTIRLALAGVQLACLAGTIVFAVKANRAARRARAAAAAVTAQVPASSPSLGGTSDRFEFNIDVSPTARDEAVSAARRQRRVY